MFWGLFKAMMHLVIFPVGFLLKLSKFASLLLLAIVGFKAVKNMLRR